MPATKTSNPWDAARKLPCVRGNWLDKPAALEPGVRFFVLMLEQLGCEPSFSCEGHPKGFYIAFTATEPVARAIDACGFFQLTFSNLGYRLSLNSAEYRADAAAMTGNTGWTTRKRNQLLRLAAASWVRHFGDLDADAVPPAVRSGPPAVHAAMTKLVIAAQDAIDFRDDPEEAVREGACLVLQDAINDAEVVLAASTDFTPASL